MKNPWHTPGVDYFEGKRLGDRFELNYQNGSNVTMKSFTNCLVIILGCLAMGFFGIKLGFYLHEMTGFIQNGTGTA